MSKTLRQVVISSTGTSGGYMASIVLDDGEKATSVEFASTDEAIAWATSYAEDAETGTDVPKDAQMTAQTIQSAQAPTPEQGVAEQPEA